MNRIGNVRQRNEDVGELERIPGADLGLIDIGYLDLLPSPAPERVLRVDPLEPHGPIRESESLGGQWIRPDHPDTLSDSLKCPSAPLAGEITRIGVARHPPRTHPP